MPLDKDRLGDKIADALIAEDGLQLNAADEATMRVKMKIIADEVIKEFKANGLVTITSVSGVTPGPGVSGPGTGSIV